MAVNRSIQEIIAAIRTAIFGKDVRESIAEGIEKCYEDTALLPDYKNFLNESLREIPIGYRIKYGIVLGTNKWASTGTDTTNYCVEVKSGDKINIKANNSLPTYYALLKSLNGMETSGTADLSESYPSVQNIVSGNEIIIYVPNDTHYLFVFEADESYIPTILKINNYDTKNTIKDNISNLNDKVKYFSDNRIYDAYDKNSLIEGYVIGEDGQPVSNPNTTYYAYTDYIPVSFGDIIHLAYVRGRDLCGGALYDSNHNFVKCIWGTDSWLHPTYNVANDFSFVVSDRNVAYLRYNVQQNSVFNRELQYVWITKKSQDYISLNNTIYVGAGQEFTTIISAAKYIIDHQIKNATVYVLAGTYNLVNEFGSTFLNNYQNDRYSGIKFGCGAHWIFSDGAYLIFNYDGSNINVAENFSPLVVSESCKLENINIEVTNCQYCIHDDWYNRLSNFIVKYKNCRMKHNGNTVGTYTGTVCIGGGLLPEELVVIDGGIYECPSTYNYPISYHSIWANLPTTHPSKLIIKNVWLSGGIRLQDADWDCNDIETIITNCSQGADIGGTHTFFDIKSWNNIIRS